MTLGVLLLLAVALATAARADLRRLADVRLRATWLVAVALLLQVAVFAVPWVTRVVAGAVVSIHLASYGLLIAFAAVNRREPGFVLAAAGLTANALVVSLNGGRMPVALDIWRREGRSAADITTTGHYNNNVLASAHTHLAFLGDVMPLPAVPLANAFSIGDVLLLLGATAFVYRRCAPARGRVVQSA